MLTREERDRLRELAVAATPGPWSVGRTKDGTAVAIDDRDGYSDVVCGGPVQCMAYCLGGTSVIEWTDADAEYIAAANPAAMLALLDALDAAEADHRIAEAARTWGQTMRLTTSDLDGDHDETVFWLGMKAAAAHDALLAALDAEAGESVTPEPRTEVTTVEERDALPAGVVVRSAGGTIACRHHSGMGVAFGDERPFSWSALALPLTVLWARRG